MLITEIRFLRVKCQPSLSSPKAETSVFENWQTESNGGRAMDAKYIREKAELCLRLAEGLSLNNPGRFQLMDLAEDFLKKTKELEAVEPIRHEAA